MLDAHTHVHFAAFEKDYRDAIERALNAGVALITVGTQKDTSRRAIEVAHEFEDQPVYATVGLHPTHTERSYHDAQELGAPSTGSGQTLKGLGGFISRGEEFDPKIYLEMAKDPKVVAIGECGLDYYRPVDPEKTKLLQQEVFVQHARVAQAVNKALMIHCRPSKGSDDAYQDILELLADSQLTKIPKVSHFFVGSPAITEKMLTAGFHFTFGGVITFARDYDEAIKLIPLDRLFVETDAPYVAPAPYRGKRNEPAYVIEVARKMAELKGVSYTELEQQIHKNAKRVFGI